MRGLTLNLLMDKEAAKKKDSLPKSINLSMVMRVVVKSWNMTDKEMEKFKRTDKEAMLVRDLLKKHLRWIFED